MTNVSSIVEWMNSGTLLEGREPFKPGIKANDYMNSLFKELTSNGWFLEKESFIKNDFKYNIDVNERGFSIKLLKK